MVRVAGLQDQVKAGFNQPENKAGLTPKQQLKKISMRAHELVDLQYDTYLHVLQPALEEAGVAFLAFFQI
ncbi:hypothetical protein GCM10020331_044200 [Ectobacillus funiculus]